MDTDYFSRRLISLTAQFNLPESLLESAVLAARETFEEQRRTNDSVSLAVEQAEATSQLAGLPAARSSERTSCDYRRACPNPVNSSR
jgi:hypothetical protein